MRVSSREVGSGGIEPPARKLRGYSSLGHHVLVASRSCRVSEREKGCRGFPGQPSVALSRMGSVDALLRLRLQILFATAMGGEIGRDDGSGSALAVVLVHRNAQGARRPRCEKQLGGRKRFAPERHG